MKEKFKTISRFMVAVAVMTIMLATGKCEANATYYGSLSGGKQGDTTANSVTVTWEAPSLYSGTVTAYYVGIGADAKAAEKSVESHATKLDTAARSYTFNGLKAGTKYYIYVNCSYNYSSGEASKYDRTVVSGNIRTLPGVVKGLNQKQWYRYIHELNVGWEDQAVDGYEIKFMNYKGKTIKKVNTTSTYATLTKVKNYTTYKCSARAYATINGKKYYSKWCPTCYCMIQPSKDDRSSTVNAKIEGGKLKVSWQKQQGVTGYNVFVSDKKNGKESSFKKVKSVKANKNSVTISKINKKSFKKGKTYVVYVQAYLKVGKRTYTTGHNYNTYVQ